MLVLLVRSPSTGVAATRGRRKKSILINRCQSRFLNRRLNRDGRLHAERRADESRVRSMCWSIDDESFYETVSVLSSVELTRATSPFSGNVAFYSPLGAGLRAEQERGRSVTSSICCSCTGTSSSNPIASSVRSKPPRTVRRSRSRSKPGTRARTSNRR